MIRGTLVCCGLAARAGFARLRCPEPDGRRAPGRSSRPRNVRRNRRRDVRARDGGGGSCIPATGWAGCGRGRRTEDAGCAGSVWAADARQSHPRTGQRGLGRRTASVPACRAGIPFRHLRRPLRSAVVRRSAALPTLGRPRRQRARNRRHDRGPGCGAAEDRDSASKPDEHCADGSVRATGRPLPYGYRLPGTNRRSRRRRGGRPRHLGWLANRGLGSPRRGRPRPRLEDALRPSLASPRRRRSTAACRIAARSRRRVRALERSAPPLRGADSRRGRRPGTGARRLGKAAAAGTRDRAGHRSGTRSGTRYSGAERATVALSASCWRIIRAAVCSDSPSRTPSATPLWNA